MIRIEEGSEETILLGTCCGRVDECINLVVHPCQLQRVQSRRWSALSGGHLPGYSLLGFSGIFPHQTPTTVLTSDGYIAVTGKERQMTFFSVRVILLQPR